MSETEGSPTPKRKRGRGRPGTTPELEDRIVRLALAGNHFDTIAAAVGVSPALLKRWLRSHRRAAFRERFEAACAEAEARNVTIIANDAASNVQSAMWLLERRWPERWARASQRDKSADKGVGDPQPGDPFAEVDELAQRRTRGT